MKPYHKINGIFKRDKKGQFQVGDWAAPEFGALQNCQWEWTEKVDGTNIRITYNESQVLVGGRTDNAQIPAPLFAAIQSLLSVEKMTEVFAGRFDVVLYGEGYGPKIQKGGGNYRGDQSFVLFDVLIGENHWLNREAVNGIAARLGLDVVPVIGQGTISEAIETVRAGALKSRWGDFSAEGIIARPVGCELFDSRGNRIITKIKAVDFPS